jgi:20S proteasome alpha/beta subunit
MTLVLASKFKEGVAFAYDKLVYDGNGTPKHLEDKVYVLNNLAVGMSGNIIDQDECASGLAEKYGHLLSDTNSRLMMHSMTDARSRSRLQKLGFNGVGIFRESYLFGFMEKGNPHLFFYDDTLTGRPAERDWEGVGFGMYPEVRSHMERNYDSNRALDDAVKVLNDGMQIAFEVNRTNGDEMRLSGLGFTVVTNEGVRRHQRQITEAELQIIFAKHGSIIQRDYREQIGSDLILRFD